jgi:Tol biopolymer transport system component
MTRFAACLALAAVAVGMTARDAAAVAQPSKIVFAGDRASSLNGEIYRLDRDGRRVDLSKSPALDVDPAVSPNGRLVAFSSNRGGRVAVYTVRIDGTGLRRVSSFFGSAFATLAGQTPLAWSPDSMRLLAVLPGGLWVNGRQIVHRTVSGAAWSPGGADLAWQDQSGGIHVVSPTGRRLWKTSGQGFAWSATGRLAVAATASSIAVYDDHGKRLARFAGANLAWSPNGKELASLVGKNLRRLQVRSVGVGRPFVDTYVAATNGTADWLGNHRLRIFTGDGWIGYDVAHRRPWTLPQGYGDGTYTFPGIGTRSGSAVVAPTAAGGEETIHVATLNGGVGPGLASATICGDDEPFGSLQFTPNGHSLVYESYCPGPSADLYSVAPNGTGLRRLTSTPTDETDPAASPSGAQISYAERDEAECKGCTETIWEMQADGSGRHALTRQMDQNTIWTDEAPSYSPDGASIVYSHWAGAAVRLDVISSGGGKPRQLPRAGSYPAWGPNRIAFLTYGSASIETVLPDGLKPRLVAKAPRFVAGGLAWSREGSLAWLEERRRGKLTLAVAHGNHVVRFPLGSLRPQYDGTGLAWSPDGGRLALTACDKTGICDVWTVGRNGSGLRRVTHDLGAGTRLSWVGG